MNGNDKIIVHNQNFSTMKKSIRNRYSKKKDQNSKIMCKAQFRLKIVLLKILAIKSQLLLQNHMTNFNQLLFQFHLVKILNAKKLSTNK